MKKDTIYIDVDDEITAIIDKVRTSPNKIVALILPKRATVFQSIVNMRLLKRTADSVKKKVVLITAEAGILPLAGVVGLHVARNLQTKPEIPMPPVATDSEVSIDAPSADTVSLDRTKTVGELAGSAAPKAVPTLPAAGQDSDVIQLDAPKPNEAAADGVKDGKTAESKKEKLDKKLIVPNFNRFRLKFLIVGLALLLLIGGWVLGYVVLPTAQVTVQADITEVPVSREFVASASADEFSLEDGIVPAAATELKKTITEKFQASGEQDKGTKATGEVTLYNCNKEDKLSDHSITINAGTGISSGEFTFITQGQAVVEPSSFVGNECQQNKPTEIAVVAQNAGDKYNLSSRTYAVSGFPSVVAKGGAMSGGTTKIVKIVSQSDFDEAKEALESSPKAEAKQELENQLKEAGLTPLSDTFTASPGMVTSTPKVGEEATEATASLEFTYKMYGIKETDIKQLIDDGVKDKYDQEKQKIYKDGVSDMKLKVSPAKDGGDIPIELTTSVSTGPQLDEEAIKREVAGKKSGEAKIALENRPGIKGADISYSPFWVFKAPTNLGKITVTFDVPESTGDGEQ